MITVMTPTYNRAYILEKAYTSLKSQTSFDFEWIVVDDGSSDDTEAVVKKWAAEENNFKITYEKQKNGGKHRAINKGVSLARYDYFLILDSDDRLTENAVETVHRWIKDIDGLEGFAGVMGLKSDNSGVSGGVPPQKYIDATNLERKKYGLLGEKAEIYKTEILRKYPFPEFEGENFLRESAVWNRIAIDGYKLRWFSEVIYLFEYVGDGLTKNTTFETCAKNFQGHTYCTKLHLQTVTGLLYYYKCGEFYKIASLKKISFRKARKILNVSSFSMMIGIFVFHIRNVYIKFFKKNGR